MIRAHLAALVGAAWLLASDVVSAQGGPPLRTDDPGTPGAGRFEINVATTFEKIGRELFVEAPLLDLNYGWGDDVQLKYEIPWVFVDDGDEVEKDGLGNSLVGVKWRFLDARDREPAISIYPQVGFENPGSSSVERRIVEPGTSVLVPFEAAWDLGDSGVNVEVGREFRDEGDDEWIAGVAVSRTLSDGVELLAEVHGEASADLDASRGVIDVGTRVDLATGCSLLASVGSGLWSQSSERTDAGAYLGIQFRF